MCMGFACRYTLASQGLDSNSLNFVCLRVLISSFKDNFTVYRNQSWCTFFSFKYFTPLSFCLHRIWRKSQCNSYSVPLKVRFFSSSGFFQIFSLFFILCLNMMYLPVDFRVFFPDVLRVSWTCGMVSDINLGKFFEITAQIFLL